MVLGYWGLKMTITLYFMVVCYIFFWSTPKSDILCTKKWLLEILAVLYGAPAWLAAAASVFWRTTKCMEDLLENLEERRRGKGEFSGFCTPRHWMDVPSRAQKEVSVCWVQVKNQIPKPWKSSIVIPLTEACRWSSGQYSTLGLCVSHLTFQFSGLILKKQTVQIGEYVYLLPKVNSIWII